MINVEARPCDALYSSQEQKSQQGTLRAAQQVLKVFYEMWMKCLNILQKRFIS